MLPPAVYTLAAVTSNLNIGLRHLIPVIPFLAIAIGIAASSFWVRWGKPATLALLLALALLAVEVLPHHSRHIQFFNLAAGGSRGGLRLLSDSNLDWGQDLPRLLHWRKQNPETRLYLYRFGHPADLARLGLDCTDLAAGDPGDGPGTLAISATFLQGLYINDPHALAYLADLRHRTPDATLADTIYLFHVPARPPLPPR